MQNLFRLVCMGLMILALSSCSAISYLTAPKAQKLTRDRFFEITGHQLLDVFTKQNLLGYIYDKGRITGVCKSVQPLVLRACLKASPIWARCKVGTAIDTPSLHLLLISRLFEK